MLLVGLYFYDFLYKIFSLEIFFLYTKKLLKKEKSITNAFGPCDKKNYSNLSNAIINFSNCFRNALISFSFDFIFFSV